MRQTFYYTATGELKREPTAAELKAAVEAQSGTIWIDLHPKDEAGWEFVLGIFKFHHLAIEDCRGRVQRPKVEEYPGHLLLVFHALNFNPGANLLDTIEIDLLLTPNLLVTVHEAPIKSVTDVAEKCAKSPDFVGRGADHLLYAIVDQMVDNFFPAVDDFEDTLDSIEDRIFENFDRKVHQDIFDAKKKMLSLRRFMGPQRETLHILSFRPLPGIRAETQIFFRDVHDHSVRLHEDIETFRDLISGSLDSYISQMSNRLNEVMKVLTIVGTIMLPLTFLTGVFGMNFDVIPGLHDPRGFWVLVGAMAALAGGMLAFFRHKDWI